MRTALYFDPVNFAPRIKATSLVAMGFLDTVSPPVGIWIAYNQIRGPKEAAPMVDSPHNHQATPEQLRPFSERSEEWLATLVRRRKVAPDPTRARPQSRASARTVAPVARTDRNSQIAHEQLLQKARNGRIDVYFLGDSITRRWGTSEAQYAHFLANWRRNFFGWNAANFGWGGDTTRNILWRVTNGELDGVDPKVIVLLAGTNDVGKAIPKGEEESKVADVAAGIEAILEVCRKKAPRATIVLMGITPRNDSMAVMPVIERINARIAKLADGKKIRFLNVNDRLADRDGRLLAGMATDGLHLDVGGYQVWADSLKPIFTELLGPPAAEDNAPPPTGDPSATNPPPS
jgi:lysophospholipase L1-like esterase